MVSYAVSIFGHWDGWNMDDPYIIIHGLILGFLAAVTFQMPVLIWVGAGISLYIITDCFEG